MNHYDDNHFSPGQDQETNGQSEQGYGSFFAPYPPTSPQSQGEPDLNVKVRGNVTVGDAILKQLSLWGVQRMYGVSGDAILSFLDSVQHQQAVRYVDVRHESAAAFMASAESKCTGRMAACTATSGPGLANMLNGIADAAADRIPLIVISGQVESASIGTNAKQYVQQQAMIAPLAVFSETVHHPDAIIDVLHNACLAARSQRGVAHVSVPKDLFQAQCTKPVRIPTNLVETVRPYQTMYMQPAATLLSTAKRPLLLIGEGARAAASEIKQLAAVLQAGVVETLGGKGIVSYDHPLHVGGIGQGGTAESEQMFKQADAVLIIGANWWPEAYAPRRTQVVKIDIDPQNIDSHPQVTYGLVGDAALVTRELLQQVQNRVQSLPIVKSDWLATVQNSKARSDEQSKQERLNGRFAENAEDVNGGLATEALTPRQVMHALDERVDHDAIIVLDTGDHTLWFNSDFRAKSQDVLYSGKWRTMGYGLPAAIAAKMVYPDKQVVAIVGDGGLAMTMMEWATAVRFNVPVIVVVMNNHSLAMEEHKMMAEGYTPFGVSLTNPDFAMLAHSFGVSGEQISSETALIAALERHLHSDKPVCLDVRTEKVMPPLTGK